MKCNQWKIGDRFERKTGNCADINLTVSQSQLLELLFGNMEAEPIAFSNGLTLNDSEMDLLDVLFPSDELFFWRTDRF